MKKINRKKRQLLILLAGMALMFTVAAAVNASGMQTGSEPAVYLTEGVNENIAWSLEDGVLTISGTGEMEETPWLDHRDQIRTVIIREGITHIAPYAFMECPALTSISFPDTVVSFGDHAVNHCPELKEVTLPASVKDFDVAPFEGSGLLNIYVDEDSPYYTSVDGVLYTKDKTVLMVYPAGRNDTEYVVPEGTERIFVSAFQYSNLEKIVLPSTLTEIDEWVFARCKALTQIEIPAGVNSVGKCAFIDVPTLISVKFTGMLPYVGDDAFAETSEGFEILYPENIGSWADVITVDPDGTEWWNIHDDCWRMKGYTGDTVLEGNYRKGSIEETDITWAISYDGTLTISGTGEIPDYDWGVYEAPWTTYRGMITSVSIGEGITGIGTHSLRGLYKLREIEIPANVRYINMGALEGCDSLEKITLSEGLEQIGFYAFAGTAISEITIPASVFELHDGTFASMNNISAYNVASDSEYFVSDENGVIYTKDGKSLVAYPIGRGEGSYTVADGVERIWGHAFQDAGLTSVILPDTLRIIGGCAFKNSCLTEIAIPASVENIDTYVFDDCENLTIARFYGDMPYIGEGFNGVPESFRIVCRADMEDWAYSEFADAGILRYFGDVSGDGVLTQTDADLLNRYFAGWEMDIDEDLLDFNTDGEVTRKDAMLLARTVAGWPGNEPVSVCGNPETQEIADKYNGLSLYVDRDSADGPEGMPGEDVANLFDHNKWTKYCLEIDGEIEVTVDFKQAHPVKAYMFRTGSDTWNYSSRNPDSWVLYGRSDISDEWSLIDEVTDGEAAMGAANHLWYGFEVDEPVAYQYYKFVFREEGIMQLSEIRFLG